MKLNWPALRTDKDENDVAEVDDEADDEDVVQDEVGHEHSPMHHIVRELADPLVLLHRAGWTGSVNLATHRQRKRVAKLKLVPRQLSRWVANLVFGWFKETTVGSSSSKVLPMTLV